MKKPLRVLIVEDSENDAALLLRELGKSGYDVHSRRVETDDAMRDALGRAPWDVVLSDFSMPEFSAMAALDVLKESGLDLPFIIVSGTISEELAVDALKAGAGDFLSKHRLARLVPAIERELRDAAVRRQRRLAEQALRESERKYRQIVETTHEGIWTVDAGGQTTYANRRMADLLRLDPDAILGKPLFHFVDDESEQVVRDGLGLTDGPSAAPVDAVKLRRSDGTTFWASLTVSSIPDEFDRPVGSLVVVTDVTERKGLEEQVRQSQKMEAIGRLAGGVAHDFNNLLTAILGYANFVLEGCSECGHNERVLEDVREIQNAADRAAALTQQLLAFGRKQTLQPVVLDLNTVVTNIEKMLHRLIGEDIDFVVRLDPAPGRVKVDPGQIEQVLVNLAVNARDAMPRGGRLTLETTNVELDEAYAESHVSVVPGAYVMLAVSDTGHGMPPEVQAHIFEPFFTTKERGRGTGLGLSTVYGIVKQSGGNIWFYSEPERGTTFKIYLPRVDAPPDRVMAGRREAEVRSGTETILLVEDDAGLRDLAQRILERHGYTVLVARGAAEAVGLSDAHQGPIHLMVSDVVMPDMDGQGLARRLAPARLDMKVLYMSGYAHTILSPRVLDAGVAFLSKPFTPEVLARKVREVLDGPAGSPGVGELRTDGSP